MDQLLVNSYQCNVVSVVLRLDQKRWVDNIVEITQIVHIFYARQFRKLSTADL